MQNHSNNEQEIVDKIQRMPMKLNERQAFVVTCWTEVLFMEFDLFWQLAEKELGIGLFNHDFANKEVWEKLKEKTKEDFEILVGKTGEDK